MGIRLHLKSKVCQEIITQILPGNYVEPEILHKATGLSLYRLQVLSNYRIDTSSRASAMIYKGNTFYDSVGFPVYLTLSEKGPL